MPIDLELTPDEIRDRFILAGYLNKSSNSEITLAPIISMSASRFEAISDEGKRVVKQARQYAGYDFNVLITGESGTGKELLARVLHGIKHPSTFKAMNCAGIVDTLFEAELFGYADGSFTGGVRGGKAGVLETAGNGTVFLDEIGELPLTQQAKLLRVLSEPFEYCRVGSTMPLKCNARFVFATNRDLVTMIAAGMFRADLYYRIKQLVINIPPLRARTDDVIVIAHAIANKHNLEASDLPAEIPVGWYAQGNVRELEGNIIRHCIDGETC